MPDAYQRPYLDSSVFIGWLKGEVCDGVDRGDVGAFILGQAERGELRIAISALILAEVHKKKGQPSLSPDDDEKIPAFFEHEYFDVVDVDQEIGTQANRYCRPYGLSPADGIHLACALQARCDVLLTWDADFDSVRRPDIRVERPQRLGQQFSFDGRNSG